MAIILRKGNTNSKSIVQEGQSVYDFAIQTYGTLDNLFTIFVNNPDIDLDTDLTAGQVLIVDLDITGNETVETLFLTTGHITNNADQSFVPIPLSGDKQFQDGDFVEFQDGDDYSYN